MKCTICNKKATYRFSPDLDIRGIGACKKHKVDVWLGYIILIQKGEKEYENYIKSFSSPKIKV